MTKPNVISFGLSFGLITLSVLATFLWSGHWLWICLPAILLMGRSKKGKREPLLWLCLCLSSLAFGGWVVLVTQPVLVTEMATLEPGSSEVFLKQLLLAQAHSTVIAFTGSFIACFLGLLIGALLGMSQGWLRRLLDPMMQTLMAIPILMFFLVGLVIFPPGPATLICVLGFTLWLEPARMIQVQLQTLKQAPFVHTARVMGMSAWRILLRECLPNMLPVIWVSFLIVFLNAILLESILGFLGLGLQPGTPSLGSFIEDGGKAWPEHPHLLLGPLMLEVAWMLGLRGLMRKADQRHRPLRVA